jgi:hypothetical protein
MKPSVRRGLATPRLVLFYSACGQSAVEMNPNSGDIFVGLGVPSSSGCAISAKTVLKASNTIGLQVSAQPAGNYCIAAEGDADSITPFTYTIQVWHS